MSVHKVSKVHARGMTYVVAYIGAQVIGVYEDVGKGVVMPRVHKSTHTYEDVVSAFQDTLV